MYSHCSQLSKLFTDSDTKLNVQLFIFVYVLHFIGINDGGFSSENHFKCTWTKSNNTSSSQSGCSSIKNQPINSARLTRANLALIVCGMKKANKFFVVSRRAKRVVSAARVTKNPPKNGGRIDLPRL